MNRFFKRIKNMPYLINFHKHRINGIKYEKKSKIYYNKFIQSNKTAKQLFSKHHNLPLKTEDPSNETILSEEPWVLYHDLIATNVKFKDIHKKKRCFILGNGPSLREQDLSLLANEITITVNSIACMENFHLIKPNYHFWADAIYFESYVDSEQYNETINCISKTLEANPKLECFIPAYYNDKAKSLGMDKIKCLNYFVADYVESLPPVLIDFTAKISSVHTVVHAAIYLAIYMGCSEIYLLGCECTGVINTLNAWLDNELNNNFYAYDLNENIKKTFYNLKNIRKIDDIFYGNYLMMYNYRTIWDYCKENYIYLCNCTPGGLLDALPRERYEDVIKR